MSDDPEIYLFDFSDDPSAAEYRERRDRARTESRRRYREHLAAALDLSGVAADIDAITDIALEILTNWSDLESGEPCHCACHPRLPDSDFHDFGFGCPCQEPGAERRQQREEWFAQMQEYWDSPEGKAQAAARRVEEAELEAWLATQPGVTVSSHGGIAPEQWTGEVDGHTFYFRERHDDWRIEIDMRPNGRTAKALRGTDDDGRPMLEDVELESGDAIAHGTIWDDGYSTTPLEKARFIVGVIRGHLRRDACDLHRRDLDALAVVLGVDVRWCPSCGMKLED